MSGDIKYFDLFSVDRKKKSAMQIINILMSQTEIHYLQHTVLYIRRNVLSCVQTSLMSKVNDVFFFFT